MAGPFPAKYTHQFMADLKKLERVLTQMAKTCEANQLRKCPILETLSQRA